MSRPLQKHIPEDIYGPSYDMLLLGLSFGPLALFIGEFVIAYLVGAPPLLLAVFGAFGIPVGGGNVRYWITLHYEMNGPRESRRRVTDRVYMRSQEGEPIPIRVLPDYPDLWIPVLEG